MNIDLIVVKTLLPDKLAEFYSILGIEFEYHNHGTGPFHYAGKIDKTVFEIYPLPKNISTADNTLRLGFSLRNIKDTIEKLKELNIKIIKQPHLNEWGYQALIEDLDGRKIELNDEDVLVSKFQIQDRFKIQGRGIVFSGIITAGEINVGNEISFVVNDVLWTRRIKDIDAGFRKLPLTEPMNFGLMIESNEEEAGELIQWNPQNQIALIKNDKNAL